MSNFFKKIKIKNLKIIKLKEGDILHALKKKELKKWKFNEAYFSKIKFGKIKAWKCHKKVTLNLIVPSGKVKFVFYFPEKKAFKVLTIGYTKYCRLTIPPKIWFGFKGLSKPESIILSLVNFQHDKKEVLRKEKNEIKFNW